MTRLPAMLLSGWLLAACATGATGRGAAEPAHDIAIVNARIIDGSGAPAYVGDVYIRDGRFADIRRGSGPALPAHRVVDAAGRVLAPGFIDLHAHGDPLRQSFENFAAMGVTTVVLGQDGSNPSAGPLREWIGALDERGSLTNVAALVGHGALRRAAGIADDTTDLSAAERERMVAVLEEWFGLGIHGVSSGLEYVPGISAQPAELRLLGETVRAHGGILMSHLRSEDDDRLEQAIAEFVAYDPKARLHISHLKVVYGRGAERARNLLATLQSYRDAGVELTADIYPYLASHTWIGIVFPPWALPPVDYATVVEQRGEELRAWLRERVTRRGGPDAILFGTEPYSGKTLTEVAREQGVDYIEALVAMGPRGGSAAHFTMDAALQDVLVTSPLTALASDGGPSMRHPRGYGSFARLIEHHVVATGQLGLEDAVHKASGMPAAILELGDRGLIRIGNHADAVVFDPARVRETATYVEPFGLAEGFDLVLVNGRIAREGGEVRDERAGKLIRRMGSTP